MYFFYNKFVLVAQSCLTLCNPVGCSMPDSSFHGIFQARLPEWVAILIFRGSSQHSYQICIFCISPTAGKSLPLRQRGSWCIIYICASLDGQYQNQTDNILCSWGWRSSIQLEKLKKKENNKELTVAQMMSSLLPNSDLNWKK